MRVGFVGLGNMGEPMARRLAEAGYNITAHDRSKERTATLGQVDGITTTANIGDCADCDLLILMLPNGQAVHDVLVGADGLAPALPAGAIIVDMSSSDPSIYRRIENGLVERDIALIDAPVSGNVSGARAGTLTIMAGGESAVLERAKPVLQTIGKAIYHLGPLGSGQVMKSLNNLLSAGGLILAIEVLLIAKKAGLDPALVNSVLNVSTGRNNSTERKIEPFVLSGTFGSGFALSLMAKDLNTALRVAKALELDTPAARGIVDLATQADRALGPGKDHTAITQFIEDYMNVGLGDKGAS